MRDSPQGLPSVSLIPGADGSPAQMLRLRALMAKKRKQTARIKRRRKLAKARKPPCEASLYSRRPYWIAKIERRAGSTPRCILRGSGVF
jgi:hypothetical protein